MAQMPVPLWVLIPCGLAILYLGWKRWQRKPERPLRHDRLWIAPTLLAAIILPLLYLQPHRPFGIADYAIFAVALVLGAASGIIRARATRLRYDHERGQLMAGFSLSALLLLIPVGIARHVSRVYFGIGPDAVSRGDTRAIVGSLLFVLAMIGAHRALLYRRARKVVSGLRSD